jgi:hypothetical protein
MIIIFMLVSYQFWPPTAAKIKLKRNFRGHPEPRQRTPSSALLNGYWCCDAAPEAGGEVGVDVLRKLFPLGEEGLEAFGAHTGVFRGIYCSTTLYDDFVEFI